ncbi:MAG: hypothetical protein AAF557_09620 [Pseudomonadota bacterium]
MSAIEIKKAVSKFEGKSKPERDRILDASKDYKSIKGKKYKEDVVRDITDALKKVQKMADACAKDLNRIFSDYKRVDHASKDEVTELNNAIAFMSDKMVSKKSMLAITTKISGNTVKITCSLK